MQIAIYFDNRKIDNVDCSDLSKGNPGIGGTEYCILLLAQMVKQYRPNIYVLLLTEKEAKLPLVDKVTIVNDLVEVVEAAKQADMLLISALRDGKPLPKDFFNAISRNGVSTILWGHNYYYSDYCKRISECDAVKANVFVGKQQYDRYIDHKIITKSTYIYNMYPMPSKKRLSMTNHTVTYIGSLVPAKGFQVVAAAWKKVVEAVPDAELNVIGSGKLYARDAKLGKYGIAEENFEKTFMTNLVDDNGEILPSVNFLGVMGAEKAEVIASTAVGVANPTGRTETFGISALDFESMSVPVVTIAKGGFLDTVVDRKTGILCAKVDGTAAAIIELLKDKKKNEAYGNAGIAMAAQFAPEIIVKDWISLFEKVLNGETADYRKPDNFKKMNLKWLRIANHDIKKLLHIKGGPSVIGLETMGVKLLGRMRNR